MKKLIVNADDFGLTEGVNRAIIESHLNGIVTSAAIMCGGQAFEQAVELAKQYPSLGVGVHLTLVAEKPVLKPEKITSIVNNTRRFLSRSELIKNLCLRKVSFTEVEAELDAQIERFLNSGLKPTHLNSHQHSHVLPGIRDVVVKLARKLGVPLRVPNERLIWNKHSGASKSLSAITPVLLKVPMKLMCKKLKRLCDSYSVKTNDLFLSPFGLIPWEDPNIRHFKLLLSIVEDGIVELMVHPGYYDELLANYWSGGEKQAKQREQELECLLDPEIKAAVKEQGIFLINYTLL